MHKLLNKHTTRIAVAAQTQVIALLIFQDHGVPVQVPLLGTLSSKLKIIYGLFRLVTIAQSTLAT